MTRMPAADASLRFRRRFVGRKGARPNQRRRRSRFEQPRFLLCNEYPEPGEAQPRQIWVIEHGARPAIRVFIVPANGEHRDQTYRAIGPAVR